MLLLISPFNVSCGYTLEASRRGILMSIKMFFLWRTDQMATLTLWLQGKFVFCYTLDPDVAQQNVGHNLGPNLLIF